VSRTLYAYSMENQKTLGEYIRELRDKKNLSLREFAAKIGDLSAAFLSDIELGRRYPSEKVLERMAKVLGVKIEDMKKHDNRPPIESMKKIIQKDMRYSIAFRRVIDEEISPEKLLKIVEESKNKKRKK
jgi:transcriptional regulator with XRE-family HTH domain